jgi:hypothetical protein
VIHGRCESCGCEDESLISVQRVYLIPAELPSDRRTGEFSSVVGDDQMVLDDIEQWCFVCRSMYPHVPFPTT